MCCTFQMDPQYVPCVVWSLDVVTVWNQSWLKPLLPAEVGNKWVAEGEVRKLCQSCKANKHLNHQWQGEEWGSCLLRHLTSLFTVVAIIWVPPFCTPFCTSGTHFSPFPESIPLLGQLWCTSREWAFLSVCLLPDFTWVWCWEESSTKVSSLLGYRFVGKLWQTGQLPSVWCFRLTCVALQQRAQSPGHVQELYGGSRYYHCRKMECAWLQIYYPETAFCCYTSLLLQVAGCVSSSSHTRQHNLWLKDVQFSICLSSCSLPEGLSFMMLIALLERGVVQPGSVPGGTALQNWGQLFPGVHLGPTPFPSVQFNWDVSLNLFLRCYFFPAFLISPTEMLMSSGCGYLKPAPFWKVKRSWLTVTSVLN